MKFKAIIVDDERLARRELRRLLAETPEVVVAGEAETLAEAAALIERARPHVVFLDIQLANENGFDLFELTAEAFRVVFVTAFDAYALRAFEVNALDYLLKPVNPERLARALERLGAERAAESGARRPFEFDDRIFVEIGARPVFLKVCEISHIASAGDYSEIFTVDRRRLLVEKPLREWEERLPSKHFLRIHRQTIVNLEQIAEIETWFNRTFRVRLRGYAAPQAVSRRYALRLKSRYS